MKSTLLDTEILTNIAQVTNEPINLQELLARAEDPKAGAAVIFSGTVRNHSHGKSVSHLDYEAYIPMAEKIVKSVIEDAQKQWELHSVICMHRVGSVAVGESAVVVITCSSHRDDAYKANRYIIDRVKHEAPIWKKEFFTDGSSEWGHNCGCFGH